MTKRNSALSALTRRNMLMGFGVSAPPVCSPLAVP